MYLHSLQCHFDLPLPWANACRTAFLCSDQAQSLEIPLQGPVWSCSLEAGCAHTHSITKNCGEYRRGSDCRNDSDLQNHRVICSSRDVLRSACPSPLLKQDQLEVSQDHMQLNISTAGDSQPFWAAYPTVWSLSQYESVFWCLDRISWVFYFVSCSLTGHWWEGSGSLFCISSLQVIIHIDKIHLYSTLNSHNFQWLLIWKMLHSLHEFYGFLLDPFHYVQITLVLDMDMLQDVISRIGSKLRSCWF